MYAVLFIAYFVKNKGRHCGVLGHLICLTEILNQLFRTEYRLVFLNLNFVYNVAAIDFI